MFTVNKIMLLGEDGKPLGKGEKFKLEIDEYREGLFDLESETEFYFHRTSLIEKRLEITIKFPENYRVDKVDISVDTPTGYNEEIRSITNKPRYNPEKREIRWEQEPLEPYTEYRIVWRKA